MKKTLILALLFSFVTGAIAFESNEWNDNFVKRNSNGVVERSYVAPAAATKITLTECYESMKITRSTYNAVVDTIVMPKGCITANNSILFATCWEIEDSSYLVSSDDVGLTFSTDTIFVEWGTSGVACDYAGILRVR